MHWETKKFFPLLLSPMNLSCLHLTRLLPLSFFSIQQVLRRFPSLCSRLETLSSNKLAFTLFPISQFILLCCLTVSVLKLIILYILSVFVVVPSGRICLVSDSTVDQMRIQTVGSHQVCVALTDVDCDLPPGEKL